MTLKEKEKYLKVELKKKMEGLTLKELTLVVKYIFRDTYSQVEINKYKKEVLKDRE